MRFPDPLVPGRLVRRYKRFLSDVELESGEVVVAHCANSGSMKGLKEPGSAVWLSPSRNPKRKLAWTWELVEADGALVGINTGLPNGLVAEAIEAGKITELTGYDSLRREVKYGKNSRIDLLLQAQGKADCYVEVKSVTLRDSKGAAAFPDAVTERGAKHLRELGDMVEAGQRAVMLYLAQRADCPHFTTAQDIDPQYDEELRRALARGVEAYCYSCQLSPEEILLEKALPVRL
ncbi:DNA/RNA nuclease SfsA [Rhodovibrionaceae bacterium A322]